MGLKAFRRVRRVDVAIAEMDNRLVLYVRGESLVVTAYPSFNEAMPRRGPASRKSASWIVSVDVGVDHKSMLFSGRRVG
jgi:hypothetical protein